MINIYLDPFVFACPQPSEGRREFDAYITNMISWGELRDASWISAHISMKTYDVLVETSRYPLWGDIQTAIDSFGIKSIQPKDIVDIAHSLLTKLPSIEKRLMVQDILADGMEINPTYHIQHRPVLFVEQYNRLIMLICLLCHVEGTNQANHKVITRYLNNDSEIVTASGKIVDVELIGATTGITLPTNVFGSFYACNNQQGLYKVIDSVTVWLSAVNDYCYRKALFIYVFQMNQVASRRKSEEKLDNFKFGDEFLNTARGNGFINDGKKVRTLLRACAETILGENMKAAHAIRIGKSGQSPQLTRGSDKAWRRDIDHEFHLHYWETDYGIEFASIVTHKDLSIPN